ncbi:YchJ family protein [Herbiconiux liukaitaii]|uniref:YchJ family protein n=1 Tax=Herbiconiux liukaitaii TaxID=3342799 RepID=UPI0035B75375
MDDSTRCPCLSGSTYGECCGLYHRGDAAAPTAERLMRSRYSAFAIGDADYLRASWHPSTRPPALELDDDVRWYRLDILDRRAGGVLDTEGEVEFRARYRPKPDRPLATAGEVHERSRFLRENGHWLYVEAL